MEKKKIISGALACALALTQFNGTMTFASVNDNGASPVVAEAGKTTPVEDNKQETITATNKGADAVKAVEALFAAIPDSITAVEVGAEGYDAYKAASEAASLAVAALDALSTEDKATAEEAIGDRLGYVKSLIKHVEVDEAKAPEAQTENKETKVAEVSVANTESSTLVAKDAGLAGTGESVIDYARLGGVTVVFGNEANNIIYVEANDSARTYGEGYEPNGITMTVNGLSADEQAGFKYLDVFNNGATTDVEGDLVPMTINVTAGIEQNEKTDAGTYSTSIHCGADSVTYSGRGFQVRTATKGKITVNKRDITVVAQDKTKTYGESDPVFDYTVKKGNIVNGDNLFAEGGNDTKLYRVHSGDSTEQVGSYLIYSNLSHRNYNITFEEAGRLNITKAALTVTGGFTDDKGVFKQINTREYGNKDLPFGFSVSGLKRGDLISDFGTVSVDFSATATSTPGDYQVTPSGLAETLKNYSVTYVPGTLHITPRSITITVDEVSKEFGETDPELTHSIVALNATTPNKPTVAWDGSPLMSLKGNVTREPGEDVGKYGIINGYTAEKNTNYKISFVAKDFVVRQAGLTITVDDVNRYYGEENPKFTVSYAGFKNGETLENNSLTGNLVISCVADKTSDVGAYVITASGYKANENYKINYVDGNLTIDARPVTVNIANLESVYGDKLKDLTHEFTCDLGDAIVNGDIIAGGITTDPTPVKNVGKYKIVSTFAHKNYDFNVNEGAYSVKARPMTVTIENKTSIYGDPIEKLTYKLSPDSLMTDDTFTGVLGFEKDTVVKNVGGYKIVCDFESPMTNYDITVVDGKYEITHATVIVRMGAASKLYGTETVIPEIEYEGFKHDDANTAFARLMAVALKARSADILPDVTVKVVEEVAGIKGYAPDGTQPVVYNDAFKYEATTFGNYKYEMASGDLSVSRLQSADSMYSVNGSKKNSDTYNSNVAIKAADGYRLSYSDALENNAWSETLEIKGDKTHNVKFYVARLSDGAITTSSTKTIKIDTYVEPSTPGIIPVSAIVNNPRTGMEFLAQNIWIAISAAGLAFVAAAGFILNKVTKKKATDVAEKEEEKSEK